MKPTQEQEAIRAAFTSGMDLVVEAGAGTGKTTTLKLLANSDYAAKRKGLYLAFNKKIATEASETFNSNVKCKTAHGLAFGYFSTKIGRHKFPGMGTKIRSDAMNLAKGFDADNWYHSIFESEFPLRDLAEEEQSQFSKAKTGNQSITLEAEIPQYGIPIQINAWDILGMIEETVRNYCISGEFSIGNQHVSGHNAAMKIVAQVNRVAFRKLMIARHLHTIEWLRSGIKEVSNLIALHASKKTDKVEIAQAVQESMKKWVLNDSAFDGRKKQKNQSQLSRIQSYLEEMLKAEVVPTSVAGKFAAKSGMDLTTTRRLGSIVDQLVTEFSEICSNANEVEVHKHVRDINAPLLSIYRPQNMAFYSTRRGPSLATGWGVSFDLMNNTKIASDGKELSLYKFVLRYARKAWEQIKDADSDISLGFDHILKMWQESKPDLGFDFIFFDEAQDANPVMAELILSQNAGTYPAQVVVVGDENQSIYDFRGASGAMKMFKKHAANSAFIVKQLTECFRFGPDIANAANNILAHTKSDLRLVGASPYNSKLLTFPEVDWRNTDAIICRQNAEIIEAAIMAVDNGRVPVINISAYEMIEIFSTLLKFHEGDLKNQPYEPKESSVFYGCNGYVDAWQLFQDSDEMYLERSIAYNVNMPGAYANGRLNKLGLNNILDNLEALDDARNSRNHPDRIEIVSAHQSKGMEWDHVVMWRNFGTTMVSTNCPFYRNDMGYPIKSDSDEGGYAIMEDLVDQEYNINYVALTRAKKTVSIPMSQPEHDLTALTRYGTEYAMRYGEGSLREVERITLSSYIEGVDYEKPESALSPLGLSPVSLLEDSGLLNQLVLITHNEVTDKFESGPSLSFQPEPGTIDRYVHGFQQDTTKATVDAMNSAYESEDRLKAIPMYLTTKRAFEFEDRRYLLVASVMGVHGKVSGQKIVVDRDLTFYDRTFRKVAHEVMESDHDSGNATKQQEDQMIEMMAFLSSSPTIDINDVVEFAKEIVEGVIKDDPTSEITLDDLADINEIFQRTNSTINISGLPGFKVQTRSVDKDGKQESYLDINEHFFDAVTVFMTEGGTVESFLAGIKNSREVSRHIDLRKTLINHFEEPEENPLRWALNSTKNEISLFGRPSQMELDWEFRKARQEEAEAESNPNSNQTTGEDLGERPRGNTIFTAAVRPEMSDDERVEALVDALRVHMEGVVVAPRSIEHAH